MQGRGRPTPAIGSGAVAAETRCCLAGVSRCGWRLGRHRGVADPGPTRGGLRNGAQWRCPGQGLRAALL